MTNERNNELPHQIDILRQIKTKVINIAKEKIYK